MIESLKCWGDGGRWRIGIGCVMLSWFRFLSTNQKPVRWTNLRHFGNHRLPSSTMLSGTRHAAIYGHFPLSLGPLLVCANAQTIHVVSSELHSSDRIGRQGKRTSNWAQTQDLRSIAEFQPCKPSIPVEILHPQLPLSTGHRCAAIQRPLKT